MALKRPRSLVSALAGSTQATPISHLLRPRHAFPKVPLRTFVHQSLKPRPLQSRPAASTILSARCFSTSQVRQRDHHFDTLKFVHRIREDFGFSEEQARALMLVLSKVIEESIQNLARTYQTKEDADRATYTQKVDFTRLRSELIAQDESNNVLTTASHERLSNEMAKTNSRLPDDIGRALAGVKLDLNLEKGRIREEIKGQDLKIKETATRNEQEIGNQRERIEAVKFASLQWLIGVCTGTAAIMLGAWRLLM